MNNHSGVRSRSLAKASLSRAIAWRDRAAQHGRKLDPADRCAMRFQALMWRWALEPSNRSHIDQLMEG